MAQDTGIRYPGIAIPRWSPQSWAHEADTLHLSHRADMHARNFLMQWEMTSQSEEVGGLHAALGPQVEYHWARASFLRFTDKGNGTYRVPGIHAPNIYSLPDCYP
ncbi:hypothetical protein TNCV_4915231 [Trichonephila clavipes]|nr:hypothetical protein TNCV_4915231 [Trichonephila clavipes]